MDGANFLFFFFQAEDGIRDFHVTGVQTCALPISGRFRIAAAADRALLVTWLRAFGTEVGELTGSPEADADDLLGYGGAAFWEAAGHPVAMAAVTRPVARTVRISMVYTAPEHRRNGYAAAVLLAVGRAALARSE